METFTGLAPEKASTDFTRGNRRLVRLNARVLIPDRALKSLLQLGFTKASDV